MNRAACGLTAVGGRALELRESEIDDLGPTVRIEHDVAGLEVAVHDTLRMSRRQAIRHLHGHQQRFVERERSAIEALLQALSVDQLHGDIGQGFGLSDVVDGGDVGMVERRRGPSLTTKALGLVASRLADVEHLEGHVTPESHVARFEHPPHAALADEGVDFVGAYSGSN